MIKQAPSPGRILAMVVFGLSCIAILLFLWLSFGGSLPLSAKSYRFKVGIPEAATLAPEADVRIAGVDVGTVKNKELDAKGARTLVEIELEARYAPIGRDARMTLRQKTILGESYLELAPGHRKRGALPDGARLPDARVDRSVELDEVAGIFDRPTQRALSAGPGELSTGLGQGTANELNDALGTLPGFADDGETLLAILDREEISLRRVIKNGGIVFGALNERRGALRELIRHSGDTFDALASRDDALAESVRIFPTFLDEARATTTRVERSLVAADPVIRDLGPAADDLRPTLRDVRRFSPDLIRTFRALPPLIDASRSGLPALEKIARGAGPVVNALPGLTHELNPIISMLGFYQQRLTDFISNGAAALQYYIGGEHVAPNTAVVDPRSFERYETRPEWDRGNAYFHPNELSRRIALEGFSAFDCSKAGRPSNRYGDVKRDDALNVPDPFKMSARRPPCLVAFPSLYDNKLYGVPQRGRAPIKKGPGYTDGGPIEGRP